MATSKTVSRLSWYVPLTHICGTLQMLPWSLQLFSIYHHPVSPWQIKCQLQMNKTTDLVLLHLDEMGWGHLSPLLRLFSVWCLIGGKVPISLCMCKISCATSITSVISYATVICSEWLVGISFATFCWWYPFIFFRFSRAGARSSCAGGFCVSVGSSPCSGDRNQRGQLPMSERPSTHEMANRHTHSCLLALAWVAVLPPTVSRGRASPCQIASDIQEEVDRYAALGKKCKNNCRGLPWPK